MLSPDGRLVVLGGRGDTIDIRDVATGSQTDRLSVWDISTGRPVGGPLTGFSGGGVDAASVVVSPDGMRVAAGDSDGTVRIFDLATHQTISRPLRLHATSSHAVGFLPDGRLLTTGSGEAAIWRLGSNLSPIATAISGHTGQTHGEFVAGTRRAITLGFEDHQLLEANIDGSAVAPVLGGHARYPAAVSPDGRIVAAGTTGGNVGLFDMITGEQLSQVDTNPDGTREMAWSQAGNVIATDGFDQTVLVWDVADPRHPQLTQTLHSPGITTPGTPSKGYLLLSTDGRLLALDDDVAKIIAVFDTTTGHPRWTANFPDGIYTAAFSPDGRNLTVNSGNNAGGAQLAFFDAATGAPQRTLQLGTNGGGVAYVQAGRTLITTAGPQANLWDNATLQPIGAPLTMPAPDIWAATPNRDGTMVALGSTDGALFIWQLDPGQWEATACQIASRTLTRAEWQKYLSSRPYHPACP